MANDWVKQATKKSPLSIYGRVHKNEREALEWLSERGGIISAVTKVMKAAKFKTIKTPKIGDIGLVLLYGNKVCMALNTGNSWFTRDENKIIGAPLSVRCLKAWNICHL